MTEQYFFAGHETLTNRGCEALLRGITTIVRETQRGAEFIAPSFDVEADNAQWSGARDQGVRFIDAYRLPLSARLWARVHKRVPAIRRAWLPKPGFPSQVRQEMGKIRAGIMTGGDVLSLDYGVPSLIKWIGQAESLIADGKPMFLWAASVGPFGAVPDLERTMVKHLGRYTGISVRESASLEYLEGLGLRGVQLVADPAFVMVPESWDVSPVLPREQGEGLLGFNISPLIKSFRSGDSHVLEMETGVVDFLADVMQRTELSVLLIPHVDTVDGSEWNSDYLYMQRLLERAQLPQTRVTIAPRNLNAAKVKHLISHCRFFIGARTHSTIAAWSTHVPTISIAYSVKAKGLNADLFGDLRYVLETPSVSRGTLWEALERLRSDEHEVVALLGQRIPEWKSKAHRAADALFANG